MTEPRTPAAAESRDWRHEPPTEVEAPDAHGKFSLNEDWAATIVGLGLLTLCLAQVIPNISGLFL